MLKNENGCPCMNAPRTVQNGVGSADGNTDSRMGQNFCDSCGGRGDCLDNMPLAYVYAPDQKFCMLYSAQDALAHGTLFEQLYKPMGVYGNE